MKHGDLGIVDLDEPRAADAALVGAKASFLADARRRGLPVLPGFVVPAALGRRLVEELLGASGADTSMSPEEDAGSGSGPHEASLDLMERVASEIDLSEAVASAAGLGGRLVARSSSPFESDGRWSGGLSSFLDVEPAQLPIAIAGCWASILKPEVLQTCSYVDVAPEDACPAVLIQPFLDAETSGVATTDPGRGVVEVVAVWGSPVPLLSGWAEGWSATVTGDLVAGAAVDAAACPNPFPTELLIEVARLAEKASTGEAVSIEWAATPGEPVLLLQVKEAPPVPERGAPWDDAPWSLGPATDISLGPEAREAVRLVARFAGPLGDAFVLPWLLVATPSDAREAETAWAQHTASSREEPVRSVTSELSAGEADLVLSARFQQACEQAEALASAAWPSGPSDALAQLVSGDLSVLDARRPVRSEAASSVMASMAAVATALVENGVIARPEQLWSLEPREVLAALRHPAPAHWPSHRGRRLRWQPLLLGVTAALGTRRAGSGVSPGVGVGPPFRLDSARDVGRIVPGAVAVVRRPAPHLAPALWVAAGLVSESGGGAAHLLEVARSLRVPAVVGVGEIVDAGDLVLVDGDLGETAWLP